MKDVLGTSILIIDDDPNIRKYLERTLAKYGFNPASSADGERGFQRFMEEHFDLIITDLIMPDISGLEVLKRIKESAPDTPVIIISGLGTTEDVIKALRNGADDYLVKPLEPEIVLHAIDRVMERKRLVDENRRYRERLEDELELKISDLQHSQTLYNSLFDNIGAGVAIYEPFNDGVDFVFVDINKSGQIFSRVKKEDILGKKVTEVFPGIRDFKLFEVFQRVWESGKPERLPVSQYRDERISQWVENYVFRLPNGFIVAVYEDMTEQRLAELEIIESGKRYSQLTKSIPGVVYRFEVSPQGEYAMTYISDSAAEIFEKPIEELTDPQKMFADVHPDDMPGFQLAISDAVEQVSVFSYNYRTVFKGGRVKWLRAIANPEKKADGTIIFDGVIIDITDQQKATEAMRNSEAFLNSIIDQSPHPMWISDDMGLLIRINQACLDLLKLSEDEVMGKYNIFKDSIVKEQGFMPLVDSVYKDGKPANFIIRWYSEELDTLTLEKKVQVTLDVTVFPIKDLNGKVTNAVIQHKDITEKVVAEKSLKENLEFLSTLLNTIPSPVFYKDINGIYRGCNKDFADTIIGMEVEEIIGKTVFEFDGLIPEDIAQSYHEKDQELFASPGTQQYESPVKCADGETRYFIFNKNCYYDDNGEVAGIIGIMTDISKRRLIEIRLLDYQAKLRNLAAHLQRIREQERRYIGGEIHDELGQKMTALKFDFINLSQELDSVDSKFSIKCEPIFELIDDIIRTIQRLSRELKPTVLDDFGLQAAVEYVVQNYKEQILIELEFDFDPDLHRVHYDIALAGYRIIQESLNNVVKHAKADKVKVSVQSEDENLHIRISDNGVGISEDRVTSTNSLGLVGMRERALSLGGRYEIEGNPNKGTIIEVTIPLRSII